MRYPKFTDQEAYLVSYLKSLEEQPNYAEALWHELPMILAATLFAVIGTWQNSAWLVAVALGALLVFHLRYALAGVQFGRKYGAIIRKFEEALGDDRSSDSL